MDWLLTFNNPHEDLEEEFKGLLGTHCSYWIYEKERGEQGTEHYQGFVQLKIKARLCTVKNILGLGRGHLEKRSGTAEEARDYCKKEGRWQEDGILQAAGRSSGLSVAVENIKRMVSNFNRSPNPKPVIPFSPGLAIFAFIKP